MTQDELQHLDAELAAGRISADEYRARRDAALGRSQAGQAGTPSGGAQQPDPQGPQSGGFPQQNPQDPQSGGFPQQNPQDPQSNPFPPAFSWNSASESGPQPQQDAPSEEATHVVQNPLLGAQPPAQDEDADRTQVVNFNSMPQAPQPPPSPQAPQPQAQQAPHQEWPAQPGWGPQQGWGASESSGTPWGDSDLPPAPEHGDTSWMRQGPEVFETAGKSSKGKLIAGLSFAGVLVVGVAVAMFFYFTAPSGDAPQADDQNQSQQPKPPPMPTSEQLPEPPAPLPPPPGTDQVLVPAPPGPPHPYNGPFIAPDLNTPKGGVLQESARDVALANGAIDGWVNRTEAESTTMLLTVRMPDEAAASKVANAYLDAQQGLAVSDELSYQGVDVMQTGGGEYRTAYVAHGWVIIVEASGSDSARFEGVLDQQLAKTPPTVLD